MSLRMQLQADPFGSYVEVDIPGLFMRGFRLTRSYAHPAILTWRMTAAQQALPLAPGAFIRFWDDAGTLPGGASQSAAAPLFEGHVQMPTPTDANLLEYTAYDPTHRAQTEGNVMSTAWAAGTVATTPPAEGAGAYPRLVFNADNIQADDDYAFSRADRQTAADMIGTILTDQYHPLYWINAAPGDGTSAGNGSPYEAGDLSGMDTEPQEKQVFESESVFSAVSRLLQQFEPARRIVWRPGTRKWRFPDITASTAVELILNKPDETELPLTFDIVPSLEGRYTAQKFYGPELTPPTAVYTRTGTLTPIASIVLEYVGSVPVIGYTQWQITNPAHRRMARALPTAIQVPLGGYYFAEIRTPSLQASWDGGNTWIVISGVAFDFQNGIASLGSITPYVYTSEGITVTTGIQHYIPPTDVRMIYAYYDTPISTRYPASGFSGTAASVAGRENCKLWYDEMLASGYTWFGTPYTTTVRLTKFYALAQKLHSQSSDIVYTGATVLDGLRYEWAWLDKRVNFTSRDADGADLTTGWEAINAYLTDVEYDFEENLTTLILSSDQMSLIGIDVDAYKRRHKIKALEQRVRWTIISVPLFGGTSRATLGGANPASGWFTAAQGNLEMVDPDTGEVVEGF